MKKGPPTHQAQRKTSVNPRVGIARRPRTAKPSIQMIHAQAFSLTANLQS
jgi:hypothetical protein